MSESVTHKGPLRQLLGGAGTAYRVVGHGLLPGGTDRSAVTSAAERLAFRAAGKGCGRYWRPEPPQDPQLAR
ncbi:hypothetical protein [Streptomyces sp. NPDC015125]|uniref:hypothetical protein n=1 Tax=Streptomyces sp. NPDC015125 TaxID=3364938 RepID=UPI0036FB2E81